MTGDARPATHRRRNRVLAAAGQVAGVVGIVLCLLLAVGTLLGRGWAVDTVDSLSQRVDQGIGRAVPPLTTASSLVGDVSGRIGDVAAAADAVAAQPAPRNEQLQQLQDRLKSLADKYLALRSTYADLREQVATAIGRIQAIDRLLPGVSLPQGPVDKLQELDARIQQVDAAIMDVIGANLVGNTVDQTAGRIAARARQAQASLDGVSDRLSGVATDLQKLQADLANIASSAKTAITLGTIGAILLFLYLALLHWILFRVSRRLWVTSGSAPAADAPAAGDLPSRDESPTEPVPGPA